MFRSVYQEHFFLKYLTDFGHCLIFRFMDGFSQPINFGCNVCVNNVIKVLINYNIYGSKPKQHQKIIKLRNQSKSFPKRMYVG